MEATKSAESVFDLSVVLPAADTAAAAVALETTVFGETFGLSEDAMATEYAPYASSSLFVAVSDRSRQMVIGAARLILPGERPLKTFSDARREWGVDLAASALQLGVLIEERQTWDVATLAVHPEYRVGTVSLALYQGICTTARLAGARWLVAGLDVSVLRLLQLRLAKGFSPFPGVEPQFYIGSMSTIVWAEISTWYSKLRAKDDRLAHVVFGGASLAPAVESPEWQLVVSGVKSYFNL